MSRKISISLLLFLIALNGHTQNEDDIGQRFFLGVNVGVKFANQNYANRYGGWYQDELYNTINIINNYNTIYEMLGQKDFYLDQYGFPVENLVRYRPGLLTGVTLGYKFSPNFQAGIDADFAKLRVVTGYTLVVIDPSQTTSQDIYETGEIVGDESRFNGRFNIDYIIEGPKSLNYIAGISGIFSAWRIDKHVAFFREFQMPLFSVHNPTNNFTAKTSGMGWGYGLNLGIEYRFNEKIVTQLMYQPYFQRADYFNTKNQIAGFSNYTPDKFRLEHDLTLRILWK